LSHAVIAAFSAAFSGGPIEGRHQYLGTTRSVLHFPLLLAAAPLKDIVSIDHRTIDGRFSAAFSGGPIEGRYRSLSNQTADSFSAAFSGGPIEGVA